MLPHLWRTTSLKRSAPSTFTVAPSAADAAIQATPASITGHAFTAATTATWYHAPCSLTLRPGGGAGLRRAQTLQEGSVRPAATWPPRRVAALQGQRHRPSRQGEQGSAKKQKPAGCLYFVLGGRAVGPGQV
jgi:hypothetical protein